LELPLLFNDYGQADKVYSKMRGYFENKLRSKGFELLGWAEVGFVKIFSNKPITKKSDLAGVKMWMWDGDVLAQSMYECLNVVPVPLSVTDVLTSLQTGLIDGAYAPELAALAFQWQTKTKFMTDVNLVDGTGAFIVTQKDWSRLSAPEQSAVRDVVNAEMANLVAATRNDNLQAQAAIKASGIQVHQLDPAALAELKQAGTCTEQKLVGKLFPQTLLDQVKAAQQ
jgi:TRAP-type C4-dicarboxylate transport system substrate-binding protein